MASGRKKQGWFKRVKEFVGSPYIRKRVRNSAVSGTSLEMKELCDWLYGVRFPRALCWQ